MPRRMTKSDVGQFIPDHLEWCWYIVEIARPDGAVDLRQFSVLSRCPFNLLNGDGDWCGSRCHPTNISIAAIAT